jgi:MOSC domain-containing protein YiiM
VGEYNGQPLYSAFRKRPAGGDTIAVTALGLAGDGQADLSVHGGPEKAVYAYPSDNWPWWEKEHRFPVGAGSFGENLTVRGADETTIRIGDRFSWGEAVVEVCQPRSPCFKFQHISGRVDASALMTLSGRTGWYFRVLKEGLASVKLGRLERVAVGTGPNIRELFLGASKHQLGREWCEEIARLPALSDAWRQKLLAQAERSRKRDS